MIYGRFGQPVKIVRMGTLEDVKKLDRRRPDQHDRKNVAAGGYVVCIDLDTPDDGEKLYHLAFLRADGALPEIMDAVRAVEGELIQSRTAVR